MILETLVTTLSQNGVPHLAPMGVHLVDREYRILPYRPSTTLDNLLTTRCAVINASDDVRIFAGCLTGRRDWPLAAADRVPCLRLRECLAHTEVELSRVEDHPVRPTLVCRVVHHADHGPFQGFNRAQFSVLEAAILVSRIEILPEHKIDQELAYLRIGLEKTAGPRENEAWNWLMAAVDRHKRATAAREPSV